MLTLLGLPAYAGYLLSLACVPSYTVPSAWIGRDTTCMFTNHVMAQCRSSEDEKVMQRSRPKRSRAEPDRFGYEVPEEPTPEQKTRRRRRNSENRNIDQYSSDDEFVGNRSRRSLRQRVEEPAKSRGDKRRKQISFRSRDTSSSSSSENIDEQSFAKRKNKRY